jgi:hypothetical protein
VIIIAQNGRIVGDIDLNTHSLVTNDSVLQAIFNKFVDYGMPVFSGGNKDGKFYDTIQYIPVSISVEGLVALQLEEYGYDTAVESYKSNKTSEINAGGVGSGRHPYGKKPKVVSDRATRALNSHKDVSKHVHMVAALNESFVANATGGVLIRGLEKSDPLKGVGPGSKATHHPFDVLLPKKKIAIEVKTLQTTKGNVVNMKMKSRLKKEKWAANNGYKKIWMVVVDTRRKDDIRVYIGPKIKKWSLTTMKEVSFKSLKRYIK